MMAIARWASVAGSAAALAAVAAVAAVAACGPREVPVEDAALPQTSADPCAAATGFRGLVVCRNEGLLALDNAVREAIAAEAGGLDPAVAAALNEEQDHWLEAARISCGAPTAETMPDEAQLICLTAALRDRLNAIGDAIDQQGPFTFLRVEAVDADPVTAAAAAASGLGEDAPTAITRDISYPQLTGDGPEFRRFNALVRQEPRFGLEDQTSETVNYTIVYAGEDLISVRFDILHEPLRAPHGSVEVQAVTVNMREGAPLTEADVFRPGSGWENFLTRRAVVALARAFQWTDFVPSEADVRETVTKPPQWLVTENALVILFPPYSFAGPQIEGGQEIAIPWSDLRAYLNPTGPRPIGTAP